MAATTSPTSEQFLALPDELDQYGNPVNKELINGEVVAMPHPALRHDIIRSNILELLFSYVSKNQQPSLKALPDTACVASTEDTFIPDAAVIAINRLNGARRYIDGAPELAIEVVSPTDSAVHLKMKAEAYLANGSRSVWIVFPEVQSVMVYTEDSAREIEGDHRIEDPLLPGFSCPVSAFFELT